MISQDKNNLYHEAQRRAALGQPAIKHTKAKSLLLTAPNNIIFDLFDTILRKMPSERFLSYFANNFKEYLELNWQNKLTQRLIKRLRREQALDLKAGLLEIPSLRRPERSKSKSSLEAGRSDEQPAEVSARRKRSPPLDSTEPPQTTQSNEQKRLLAINQIYQHVLWRIKTNNVSQVTTLMVKLALDDGYKRAKLKADLYEDVASNFQLWRSEFLIKLYAFGDAPPSDQKLLLSNTSQGDLSRWIANYIDGSEKRQNVDLLRKLASALRDKTKNCMFITNNLTDALAALETNALRSVLLVDRLNSCDNLDSLFLANIQLESLLKTGKLFILSSLDCLEFAPDPTSATCC